MSATLLLVTIIEALSLLGRVAYGISTTAGRTRSTRGQETLDAQALPVTQTPSRQTLANATSTMCLPFAFVAGKVTALVTMCSKARRSRNGLAANAETGCILTICAYSGFGLAIVPIVGCTSAKADCAHGQTAPPGLAAT
jgi:hypothetical protein